MMTSEGSPSWRQAFGSTFLVIGAIAVGCLVIGILLNRFFLPSATEAEILEDLQALKVAVVSFRQDHEGQLPTQLSDLLAPAKGERRRYINRIPSDPWGNAYDYEKSPDGFRLTCLGRDEQPGGEGEDGDFAIEWRAPFTENR